MIQMINTRQIALSITILIIALCSCDAESFPELNDLFSSEYQLLGGSSNSENNFIIVQINTAPLKTNYLIIFDDEYRVINYLRILRSTSRFPVSMNDQYFAFGCFRNENESGQSIVIYDKVKNRFTTINTGYHFIGNIFLSGGLLFFSSEKGNPSLNVLSISTLEVTSFSNPYLPSAQFYEFDNHVYATQPRLNPSISFKYSDNSFKRETTPEGIEVHNYTIENFSFNSDLIYSLKF